MTVSFIYLLTQVFVVYFSRLNTLTKIIMIWSLPLLGLLALSMVVKGYTQVQIYLNSFFIFLAIYSVLFQFAPLLIRNIGFNLSGLYIPCKLQFILLLRYLVLFLYACVFSLFILVPFILLVYLGFFLVGVNPEDQYMMIKILVCTLMFVLYIVVSLLYMYLSIKLNWGLIALFDEDIPLTKVLFLQVGFKNALKIIFANLFTIQVFSVFFTIAILLVVAIITMLIGSIDSFELPKISYEKEEEINPLLMMIFFYIIFLVMAFIHGFRLIFNIICYKKYVQSAILKV